jgi:hypothetical protein
MKLQTSLVSLAAVLASTAIASSAAAQAPFKVNDVIVNGSGCERRDFTVRTNNRGEQELNIRFRDFDAQGGAAIGERANATIKSCEIAADVTIPSGFQLVLVESELRGRADVQGRQDTDMGINNAARVMRRYGFNDAGPIGDLRASRETVIVNTDSNYSITDRFAFATFGECGATRTIARLGLSLFVTGRNNFASIRSLEESADGIRFAFRARRCNDPVEIIPIATDEVVKNACVLNGNRRTCYDRNGNGL